MKNARILINNLNTDNLLYVLSTDEITLIQGGIWPAVAIAVGGYVIANWSDVKKGLSDGFNQQ